MVGNVYQWKMDSVGGSKATKISFRGKKEDSMKFGRRVKDYKYLGLKCLSHYL